ncbi:MAG: ECF transporter S component [Bacillota bacterium]
MKFELKPMVQTAVLLALALAVQSAGFGQMITGPVINAILLLTAAFVGPVFGIIVGLITPWVALTTGIMKFAPALPVIMAGNAALVLTFYFLRTVLSRSLDARPACWIAAGSAAVVKYAVMTAGVKLVLAPSIKVPPLLVTTLTINQLFTALGGALVAAIIIQSSAWRRQTR